MHIAIFYNALLRSGFWFVFLFLIRDTYFFLWAVFHSLDLLSREIALLQELGETLVGVVVLGALLCMCSSFFRRSISNYLFSSVSTSKVPHMQL